MRTVVRSVVVSYKILLEKCVEFCFDKLMYAYARSSHMFYMGMISYSESYHDRTLPSLSLGDATLLLSLWQSGRDINFSPSNFVLQFAMDSR